MTSLVLLGVCSSYGSLLGCPNFLQWGEFEDLFRADFREDLADLFPGVGLLFHTKLLFGRSFVFHTGSVSLLIEQYGQACQVSSPSHLPEPGNGYQGSL
jgi:hypothetical protein